MGSEAVGESVRSDGVVDQMTSASSSSKGLESGDGCLRIPRNRIAEAEEEEEEDLRLRSSMEDRTAEIVLQRFFCSEDRVGALHGEWKEIHEEGEEDEEAGTATSAILLALMAIGKGGGSGWVGWWR